MVAQVTDSVWPERELPSGVYRHYKGGLYLVLGYAHDANADELMDKRRWVEDRVDPSFLNGRTVVVYIGLELNDAHTGPRLAVRTAEDFFAMLHSDGSVCDRFGSFVAGYPDGRRVYHCNHVGVRDGGIVPRFEYEGVTYEPSLLTQPGAVDG